MRDRVEVFIIVKIWCDDNNSYPVLCCLTDLTSPSLHQGPPLRGIIFLLNVKQGKIHRYFSTHPILIQDSASFSNLGNRFFLPSMLRGIRHPSVQPRHVEQMITILFADVKCLSPGNKLVDPPGSLSERLNIWVSVLHHSEELSLHQTVCLCYSFIASRVKRAEAKAK